MVNPGWSICGMPPCPPKKNTILPGAWKLTRVVKHPRISLFVLNEVIQSMDVPPKFDIYHNTHMCIYIYLEAQEFHDWLEFLYLTASCFTFSSHFLLRKLYTATGHNTLQARHYLRPSTMLSLQRNFPRIEAQLKHSSKGGCLHLRGKRLHNYGKSQFLMGKSTINVHVP